jgi:ubiquinone/menaquinone biosynthesis C-methylase UbiE
MLRKQKHVCPIEKAGGLDSRFRRWLQNPDKIAGPYIAEGMHVLDFGCGPGFFTAPIAERAGASGRVIASDMQAGMLDLVRGKFENTDLEDRIVLHQCGETRINLEETVDLVFAFYVIHEVPDPAACFRDFAGIVRPDGAVFMAEPLLHVSKKDFEATIHIAEQHGFRLAERPKIFFSRAALLRREAG